MRKIIIVGIAAAATGLGFYLLNHHHGVSPSLRVTSAEHPFAPEFALPDMSGQQLRLSNYRGKVVLLDFWATWCEPCREEIPHFVDLQNKLSDQGFQIIGVSMDDGPEPVRDFYRQFKMNYPVVMGNGRDWRALWRSSRTAHRFCDRARRPHLLQANRGHGSFVTGTRDRSAAAGSETFTAKSISRASLRTVRDRPLVARHH